MEQVHVTHVGLRKEAHAMLVPNLGIGKRAQDVTNGRATRMTRAQSPRITILFVMCGRRNYYQTKTVARGA